jgi:hypothetical protein
MAIAPGSAARIVHRCGDYMEADLLVRVLADEGIPAACHNSGPSAGISGTMALGDGLEAMPWAEWVVMVPGELEDRARDVIAGWLSAVPIPDES